MAKEKLQTIPKITKMKVRITLIEDILGTLPGDPEVYKSYIASKAPEGKDISDEIEAIGQDGVYEKGMTVFIRDMDGKPCIFDYLIKGFFKNAANALNNADGVTKLTAYKRKIDNLVFVGPRFIELKYNNIGDMSVCERPLRASTPQGERVALACSESIPAGTTFDIDIECLNAEMMGYVRSWLDYGKWNGLGQWHNSGKGRFTWEEIK